MEQRNTYKGDPARAVLRIQLISPSGEEAKADFLVDTGNPCAIIIASSAMRQFRWRESVSTNSNFGFLESGWLQIAIPNIAFDHKILGYSNDKVVDVVKRSDSSFVGLVGLPLLRFLEYGGNSGSFWVRASE